MPSLVIILVLSVVLYCFYSSSSFSKTNKWTLVQMVTCPACMKQKQLLKQLNVDTAKYDVTTCADSPSLCQTFKVNAVPAWIQLSTKKTRVGLQSEQQLKEMGLL